MDKQFHAIGIALEMGYLIALPLVGFALAGVYLDTAFNTKPLILLLGMVLAIAISTVLVYRKTKEMINDTTDSTKDKKEI